MVSEADLTDPRNPKSQNPRRAPLLDNGVGPKKPKSKQVHSRYMSPTPSAFTSSSKRYQSPILSPQPNHAPKRAQSVDCKRPADFRLTTASAPSSSKSLFTSTRSLSVSFQGQAFSLPISKAKTTPQLVLTRKLTPERRRSVTPSRVKAADDRCLWPGKTCNSNPLSLSLDCDKKLIGIVKKPVMSETRLSLDLTRAEVSKRVQSSDTDSISSGSTSGMQEHNQSTLRSIVGSARFWQETNRRLRRLQDSSWQLPTSPASRMVCPRGTMSPVRSSISPRGISGPTRVRSNGYLSSITNGNSNALSSPSILSFSVDVRRGKVRDDRRLVDAHMLRLLYNRTLQWQFVNANAEATISVQRSHSEKRLWNASITISDLRRSVRIKRVELQLIRQKLKLTSILKRQMGYLDECVLLDREHFISLTGAIEALKASTFRLPLIGGAMADNQSVKDAIGSAANVLYAMASLISSFLSKLEELNSLIKELADVTAKERVFLRRCKDVFSILAAIQEKDYSLRAQKLQLYCLPTT